MEREKGAEKRGNGVGSRQTFTLLAKWQEEEYERGNKTRLHFSSPGKTKYKTQKAIKETLVMRGMEECLHDHLASASSSEESQTKDPEFMPSIEGEETKESQMKLRKGEETERRLVVCESSQKDYHITPHINYACIPHYSCMCERLERVCKSPISPHSLNKRRHGHGLDFVFCFCSFSVYFSFLCPFACRRRRVELQNWCFRPG